MKKIFVIVLSLVVMSGCSQNNGVTLTQAEYDALMSLVQTDESTGEPVTKEDVDLFGTWGGTYYLKTTDSDGNNVTTDESAVASLTVNVDGTYALIYGQGNYVKGTWDNISDGVISLSYKKADSDSTYYQGNFGRKGGSYYLTIVDWYHYDVEMTRE